MATDKDGVERLCNAIIGRVACGRGISGSTYGEIIDTLRALLSRAEAAEAERDTISALTLGQAVEAVEGSKVLDPLEEEDDNYNTALDEAQAAIRALSPMPPAQAAAKVLLGAESEIHEKYILIWLAGARPVHPKKMRGSQSFKTFEMAIDFFKSCAPDSEFVSLTRVQTQRTETDMSTSALHAIAKGQSDG